MNNILLKIKQSFFYIFLYILVITKSIVLYIYIFYYIICIFSIIIILSFLFVYNNHYSVTCHLLSLLLFCVCVCVCVCVNLRPYRSLTNTLTHLHFLFIRLTVFQSGTYIDIKNNNACLLLSLIARFFIWFQSTI